MFGLQEFMNASGTSRKTALCGGKRISVPATFNLANVPGGEFKGEIRIAHADGTASVPVAVCQGSVPVAFPGPFGGE